MNAFKIIKLKMTWPVILIIGMLSPMSLYSQDSDNELQEKKSVRMSMDFHRINNDQVKLVTRLRTKEGRSFVPVKWVKIDFYRSEVSEETLIGSSRSGENGEATINFEDIPGSDVWEIYIAVLEDNPEYDDAEEEVEVMKSIMEFEANEIDSQRTVEVYVGSLDSLGNPVPAEEAEVRLFVERLFGLLPVGEGDYTDEEGKVELEFPMDMPGDENGMLTVVAMVDDHEDFGYLSYTQELEWGVPLVDKEEGAPDIWLASPSSNASFYLVIATNAVLVIIYGVIGYMIFLLLKIKRLGQNLAKEEL